MESPLISMIIAINPLGIMSLSASVWGWASATAGAWWNTGVAWGLQGGWRTPGAYCTVGAVCTAGTSGTDGDGWIAGTCCTAVWDAEWCQINLCMHSWA